MSDRPIHEVLAEISAKVPPEEWAKLDKTHYADPDTLATLNRLERENAALRAELERVRKDAERYRHLRDHGGADLFGGTASMSIGKHPMIVYFAPSLNHANMVSLFAENADYMVDAAIAQGKGEK